MKRIHAWQNWLDEKCAKTHRDSDTREWRDRRDRWDLYKIKPPLFGSAHLTLYDVEREKNWRQAADDRRALSEKAPTLAPNDLLPYIRTDERHHDKKIAQESRQAKKQRRGRKNLRATGRKPKPKRKPRPRRPN